jgi:hypothetical protein
MGKEEGTGKKGEIHNLCVHGNSKNSVNEPKI